MNSQFPWGIAPLGYHPVPAVRPAAPERAGMAPWLGTPCAPQGRAPGAASQLGQDRSDNLNRPGFGFLMSYMCL